eukprot:tig00000615_g2547.t1
MSFAAGSRWRGELRDGDGETSTLELTVHNVNDAGAFTGEVKVAKSGGESHANKIRGFATLDDSSQIGDYATIGMLVDDGSAAGALTISEFMKPQKVAKYTGTLVGDSIDGDWNEGDAGGDFSLKFLDPSAPPASPGVRSVKTPKSIKVESPKPPPTPPAPAQPAPPVAQPAPLPSPSLRESVDRAPAPAARAEFQSKAGADDEVLIESSPVKPPPTPPAPAPAPAEPAAPPAPPKAAQKEEEEDDPYDFSNAPAQKLASAPQPSSQLLPPSRSKYSKPPELETITEAEHSYISEASPMKGVPPSPGPAKAAPPAAGGAKALHFDGAGGACVELPGNGSLAMGPAHDFTIAMSVRREEGRGGVLVCRSAQGKGGVSFAGGLHADGRAYLIFRNGEEFCLCESSARAPAGRYADVAFVKEGDFAALHVEGQEEDTREFHRFEGPQLVEPLFVGAPGSQAAWEALVTGVAKLEEAPRFFCGRVRHLSVWERPLEPSECAHAASLALTGAESGLCALYKFAGGSPSTLPDATSHENTARIRGAIWADADAAAGLPVHPEKPAPAPARPAEPKPEHPKAEPPKPEPPKPEPPKAEPPKAEPKPDPPAAPPAAPLLPEPAVQEDSVKNIQEKIAQFRRMSEALVRASSSDATPARSPSPTAPAPGAPSSANELRPPAPAGLPTAQSAPQPPSSSPALLPPVAASPIRATSAPPAATSPRSAPPQPPAFPQPPPSQPAAPAAPLKPTPQPAAAAAPRRGKRMEEWGVEDVGAWLEGLGLAQYRRVFAESAVDGSLLAALQDGELRDALEVENPLHLKKMRLAIESQRDRSRPGPGPPGPAPSPPSSGLFVPSSARPASAGRARPSSATARPAPAGGSSPSSRPTSAGPSRPASAGASRPASAGPRRSVSEPVPPQAPPPPPPPAPAPPAVQQSTSEYGPFIVPARKPTASDMAALQLDDKKGAWVYCKPKNSWIYVLRQEAPPAPPGERPARRPRPASAGAGERSGPYRAGARPASSQELSAPPQPAYGDAVNPALLEIQRQLGYRNPGGAPAGPAPNSSRGSRKPRPASAKARLESPTKQSAWAAGSEGQGTPESRRGRSSRIGREDVILEEEGPGGAAGAGEEPGRPPAGGAPLVTPDERLDEIIKAIEACEREDGEAALHRRVELCVERLALCQLKYGERHLEIVRAHWKLAEAYMDGGLFEQSIQHALSARDLNIAIGSDESRRIHPEILLTLGLCYTRTGQLGQARTFLTKSLKYSTAMFGDADRRLASVHMALAAVEKRELRFERAVQHLQAARRIKAPFLPTAPEVRSELADISVLLAKVCAAKGEEDEAAQHLAEALRDYREAAADEGLSQADREQSRVLAADTSVRVGKGHMRVQDFRSAEPFFREALAAYEAVFGVKDVRSIAVRRELGLLYVKWRRFPEAQVVLKVLLTAERQFYGADSVKPADTARVLGTVYLADQRLPEALEMYQTVLRVYRAEYGPKDKRVRSIAARIAEVREQLVKQTAADVDKAVNGSPHAPDADALVY